MEVPDCELGENGLFVFADCAVNPDVDSEKLARNRYVISKKLESIYSAKSKVAMLSFSSTAVQSTTE